MSPPLFTIGYEGATPDALVAALREAGVTMLIDVRALANSRRPGFAKRALSEALERAGITYRHVPALGTPAEGRAAARAGRSAEMRRIFAARLAGAEAQAALAGLAMEAEAGRVCLLCLEADPAQCHRSIIAEAVAAAERCDIIHLHPGGRLPRSQRGVSAMTLSLILHDLSGLAPEDERRLLDSIFHIAPEHWRVSDGATLAATSVSPAYLRDHLLSALPASARAAARLLVTRAAPGLAWHGLPAEGEAWLREGLEDG